LNKPHGKGYYVWKTGSTYDGDWLKGVKEGKGKWMGESGETYEGDWV